MKRFCPSFEADQAEATEVPPATSQLKGPAAFLGALRGFINPIMTQSFRFCRTHPVFSLTSTLSDRPASYELGKNDFVTSACPDSSELNFSPWLKSLLIRFPLSPHSFRGTCEARPRDVLAGFSFTTLSTPEAQVVHLKEISFCSVGTPD